jgi:predicted RNA methylase
MGTDIGLILQRLLAFYDFSGKYVIAVGAGGGQLAGYARSMRKVLAVDRDLEAMGQLQEAAARLNLQDRFEYWTGDFADCDRRADVVLFEFCLHEMDDPSAAVHKATTLAPEIVVIDHSPGSPWVFFTAEDDKVARSWLASGRMQVMRQCSYAGEQRFADYEGLHAKVKSQGEESIRRTQRFREQTSLAIPMTYALALIRGTAA